MDIMAIRLRTLREKMGMPQAKLAKEIGVTQASVNRYETARVTPPAEVLLFYADRFDVSLDYIFGRTEKLQGNSTIIIRSHRWIQTKCASLLRCALTRNPP